MIAVGDKAPKFKLEATTGKRVSLKKLRGRAVVLYFYPKDDTPGCTREACDFRDNMARLTAADVEVLGVSKDTLASHAAFQAKYALPFPLLSDPDNAVARSYGAFGEKKVRGKVSTGTIRSTFLIDARGRIARSWSPVEVEGHVDAVLAASSELSVAKPKKVKQDAKAKKPKRDAKAKKPKRDAKAKKPKRDAKARLSAKKPKQAAQARLSAKKAPARKTAAKQAPARKTAAKQAPARKTAAKKAPARKTAAKKAPARKTAAKKAPARKTAASKAPAQD